MSYKLTADRVEAVLKDSLFDAAEVEGLTREEALAKSVVVEGIDQSYALHPDRLANHRDEVYEMLSELPDVFRVSSAGGGSSFLKARQDKHGNRWTGFDRTVDQLFVLGIAVGLAKWLAPREMWTALPGGMPYVAFLDTDESRESPAGLSS